MFKKKIIVSCVLFGFFAGGLNAQAVISAPILETIMATTHADQVLYYAQSIAQAIQSAQNTYNQFQNLLRQEQLAMQNLKGITKVDSFKDFMSWYNRQLSLERRSEQGMKNLNIDIGGKKYSLHDTKEIRKAAQSGYIDFWKNDFSPEQRREFWINNGLSPSNYAYVQVWKGREEKLADQIHTKLDTINSDNMEAMERNKAIADEINEDANKPEDQKMGEKKILSHIASVSLDTNRAIREMLYDNAQNAAYTAAQYELRKKPPEPPRLSERYNADDFAPEPEF